MQYMHSLELNNRFIVLGVTGPLRSGCTTTANFFSNEIIGEARKYINDSNQINIEESYKELKAALDEYDDTNVTEAKKRSLYALLKDREIKDVLSTRIDTHVVKPFVHISMSKMLLKFVVEYYLNNKTRFYDTTFSDIIGCIDKSGIDIKSVNIANGIITNKKYRDLDNEMCGYFDAYIASLDILYESLRLSIIPDKLGTLLQDIGDNIRRSGTPFSNSTMYDSKNVVNIAEQANMMIKYYRNRQDSEDKRRHHFVIESFRNPYEIEYFRYRYYEFYLLSVYANKKTRQSDRGLFSESRDNRDSGSTKNIEEIYKQDVTKCVYLSDICINNEGSITEYYNKLLKYYAMILQPGCITPSLQEVFMNEAYALSLKSSCISRQVGAIIIGKNGYVVGAGWNDAGEGQVGCGYRQIQDVKNLDNDVLVTNPASEKVFRRLLQRDKAIHEPFCYKDEYSSFFLSKKISKFMKVNKQEFHGIGNKEDKQELIEQWLKDGLKIKRLEYCRALHAEENALLQSAKIGGVGVKGGTIYTTSFPCELCAKKIYQSGITEVIYTEPYPDSISEQVILKDGIKRIKLTQFEGVKSHSYFRLYKANMDKKEMLEICKLEKKRPDELSLF